MQKLKYFLKLIPFREKMLFLSIGFFYGSVYLLQYYSPIFQKRFVDFAINEKLLFNEFFYALIYLEVGFIASKIVTTFLMGYLELRLEKKMFFMLFEKIVFLKKSDIVQKGSGYYYDLLSASLEEALSVFGLTVYDFLYSTIQVIFIFALMNIWSKILFWIFLAVFIVSIAIIYISAKLDAYIYSHMREKASKLAGTVIDVISNNALVRYLLIFSEMKKNVMHKFDRYQKYSKMDSYVGKLPTIGLELLKSIYMIFLLLYTINLVIKGEFSYGGLVAVLGYGVMIFQPISYALQLVSLFRRTEIGISRVHHVFQIVDEKQGIIALPVNEDKCILAAKKLSIGYTQKICEDVSFHVLKGTRMGLIGLSGEGKSSILKLFLKELMPDGGDVLYKGEMLFDITDTYYFGKINILPQTIEIFNQSLQYNLTVGRTVIKKNEEVSVINQLTKSMEALKKGEDHIKDGIIDEISADFSLSNKVNREMMKEFLKYHEDELIQIYFGKHFVIQEELDAVIDLLELRKLGDRALGESGNFISGGEKQRLILGRFLLKKAYDFFIIDEPFTSLDIIAEKKLISILKENIKGKTGIIVSHKFNILNELCTEFIYLDKGKIVESGTHEELLKKKARYYALYQTYYQSHTKN